MVSIVACEAGMCGFDSLAQLVDPLYYIVDLVPCVFTQASVNINISSNL